MILAIVLLVVGIIIVGELIYCIYDSRKASDFTYHLCRPFGIDMPTLRIGIIVRVCLVVIATIAIMCGIALI